MSLSFDDLCKSYWIREVITPTQPRSFNPFPREMDEKRRFPEAINWLSYFTFIKQKIAQKKNAFIAFYSDYERLHTQTSGLYRIFLDVDRKDTWKDMQYFLLSFWDNIDVYFSGSKGFHITLYVKPDNTKDLPFGNMNFNTRNYMRQVLSTWLQNNIDSRTFLDLSRMYRIAFTKHPYNGNWKIPISPEWDLETIEKFSAKPEEHIDNFLPLYQKKLMPIDWKIFLTNPKDFILGTTT